MMASIIFLGLIYQICEVYLDDIIVYGNGFDQFCERLEILFQRLENKNISLKAAKLKLNVQIVKYVGRQISKEGITMSSKKIRGVADFPMPRKTTELRSFLGLTNYFRDHVPNHSNVVAPLCGSLRVCYPIQPIRCCFHLSTFVFTATTISH